MENGKSSSGTKTNKIMEMRMNMKGRGTEKQSAAWRGGLMKEK